MSPSSEAAPLIASLSLRGATVLVTGARRGKGFADMVARLGGVPVLAPTVGQEPLDSSEQVAASIQRIGRGDVAWAIFLTGVGARALFEAAEGLGQRGALASGLQRGKVLARGPKAVSALTTYGIPVSLVPQEATSEGVVAALRQHAGRLDGLTVAVQLYGRPNPYLRRELLALGAAEVMDIPLYQYTLPPDELVVERALRDLVLRKTDAATFTSAPAVHNLFLIAEERRLDGALREAFRERVIAAAVGPTTASALREAGIEPQVVAEDHTQAGLLKALASYMAQRRPAVGAASAPPLSYPTQEHRPETPG